MNIDTSPDLIVRALVTRIEHLEAPTDAAEAARHMADAAIEQVAAYLFPASDSVEWATTTAAEIIEELKRRGCGV